MQHLEKPALNESSGSATANGPQSSTVGSEGKNPEFEKKADLWTEELVANLNRNAKQGAPTS